MELEFDVKMTPAAMYDYLLHHTYSVMSGIVGAIAGAFCIIVFAANKYPIYLIAGIIILAYLPISLFLKANQQVQGTPAFKKPLHYKMTEGQEEEQIVTEMDVTALDEYISGLSAEAAE